LRVGCAATARAVVEVDRPGRAARRRQGKAGTATGTPKAGDGRVEMIRSLDELIPARVRGRVDLVINGSFWLGKRVVPAAPLPPGAA